MVKVKKNDSIIGYKLLSLVFCNKEMSKNQKNRWKYLISTEKFFISSERLEEFQWHFQERCDLDNIKSHKKQGFTLCLEDTFFEKPQGGGLNWPPAVLGLNKQSMIILQSQIIDQFKTWILVLNSIVWFISFLLISFLFF